MILTAVVLALVMVLNVLAGALPENMTKYDMSATKLYSVTGNTRAVISALEDDVTIYWIDVYKRQAVISLSSLLKIWVSG